MNYTGKCFLCVPSHVNPTEHDYRKTYETPDSLTIPKGLKQQADFYANYLVEHRHIQVPTNFASELLKVHRNHHVSESNIRLSIKTVNAIVNTCIHVWMEYLETPKNMIHVLICNEVLSMARLGLSVLSTKYISEIKGVQLKKETPSSLTTIINSEGEVQKRI